MVLIKFSVLVNLLSLTLSAPSDAFKSSLFDIQFLGSNFLGTRTLLPYKNTIISLSRGLEAVVDLSGTVLVDAKGLGVNHGLAILNGYFYYSSDTTVYRSNEIIKHEIVVTGMSKNGNGGAPQGHTTRTILFNDTMMYIGVSSGENVDPDSFRARVRRVDLAKAKLPIEFENMEVFADGLRNPLAMAFDKDKRLWELDNGPDSLQRPGFEGDDDPIEELNLLQAGKKYGYPWCFSRGSESVPFEKIDKSSVEFMKQFAWNTAITSDEYCRNTTLNTPPLSGVMSHSSPIQMLFLTSEMGCTDSSEYGKFPCSWVGDLIATLHGSWDRSVPSGYGLIRIPFVKNRPTLPSKHQYLARVENYEVDCKSGGGANLKCFRPAGIAVKDGSFYVGSGATGEIVKLTYNHEKASKRKTRNRRS